MNNEHLVGDHNLFLFLRFSSATASLSEGSKSELLQDSSRGNDPINFICSPFYLCINK